MVGAKVVDLAEYRKRKTEQLAESEENALDELDQDAEVNELWDKLEEACEYAWEWRDHASLDAMLQVVSQIRPFVEIRPPEEVTADGGL